MYTYPEGQRATGLAPRALGLGPKRAVPRGQQKPSRAATRRLPRRALGDDLPGGRRPGLPEHGWRSKAPRLLLLQGKSNEIQKRAALSQRNPTKSKTSQFEGLISIRRAKFGFRWIWLDFF